MEDLARSALATLGFRSFYRFSLLAGLSDVTVGKVLKGNYRNLTQQSFLLIYSTVKDQYEIRKRELNREQRKIVKRLLSELLMQMTGELILPPELEEPVKKLRGKRIRPADNVEDV